MRCEGWVKPACLIGVIAAACGPWTEAWARLMALREFEENSVLLMILHMLPKVPPTFVTGWIPFVAVPVGLLLARALSSRLADAVRLVFLAGCATLSVALHPLLLVGVAERDAPNVIGDVLTADLLTMYAVHIGFVLVDALPPLTLFGGPLLGLCSLLIQDGPRPSNLFLGIVALYANIGALRAGYRTMEGLGSATFAQTIALDEWHAYEVYAAVSIFGGFLVLCSSLPVPRTCAQAMETALYLVLINANIAAAWAATEGVTRRRMTTPRVPWSVLRCVFGAERRA